MGIEQTLAGMPGVRAAQDRVRDRIAASAIAAFTGHDAPGGHEITTSRVGDTALVSLVGPAAAAVEYGHIAKDGAPVDGLHVLRGALR